MTAQVALGVGRRADLTAAAGRSALVARVHADGVAVPELDVGALIAVHVLASCTVSTSSSGRPGRPSVMSRRVRWLSIQYGPSVTSGLRTHAVAASAPGAEHAGRARAQGAREAQSGEGEHRFAAAQQTGFLVHGASIGLRSQSRLSRT